MKPLKQPENSLLCDPSLVDEIFDQIPELLEHHEQFLEQIHDCVQNWHEKQKVGDLLVQSVGPDPVPERGGDEKGPSRSSPRAQALLSAGKKPGAGSRGMTEGRANHVGDGERQSPGPRSALA